ncbi:MAG: FAD-binding oxidoreductase [Halobacteriales archaeon]|nr:FAD-binding oxidoreductase [Halobacteriales archaeon]
MSLPAEAEHVIIGAGVVGLGTAFRLAQRGIKDVVVLDRGYVLSGASGRNGGGVRAQWTTKENIELARRSIAMFRKLPEELGIQIWFRQGGYLLLAFDEAQAQGLRKAVQFQNANGIPTRLLTEGEAHEVVPELRTPGLVQASFGPTDGVLFPWPVVWGYYQKCRELGVHVSFHTEVLGLDQQGSRIARVRTSRGDVRVRGQVVNCTGAWSRELSGMVGVAMPNEPVRHEILSTEPLKPFLKPMVVDLRNGLYMSQVMRGEVVTGIGDPNEKPGFGQGSSLHFLQSIARAIVDLMPTMRHVKVVRQWAGLYDMTPDHVPILGPTPGFDNFVQANGFSGHGFMVSPMVNTLLAELLAGERTTLDLKPFALERFARGEMVHESFVIG